MRAGRARGARSPPGTSSWRATAIALRDDRAARRRRPAPSRFAGWRARARPGGRRPSCATGRARRRPTPEELAAELAERLDADLERGFTSHGPHRDDLALLRDGRELRVYGSQGEQRLALLALLLAERDVLDEERGAPPLLLLDDVMSELDAERRARLVARLGAGQA